MKTRLMATVIMALFLVGVATSCIAPAKATILPLTFRVTSADIIMGVDALNQWLVVNGMDTFAGTHMPAEARIPGQTIMSLVNSVPQRSLGDFWFYPYDPYNYFGGEGGNPPLGFDTWTSVMGQATNVASWVDDNSFWGWGIPWWHALDYGTYPNPAFRAELIAPPGSSADEFYFTISIDTSQADVNGKYRFLFSGDSYRNPPIGGSDESQFLGFVDLVPLPLSPQTVKLDAIAELEAAKVGAKPGVVKRISDAIEKIQKSLKDSLWTSNVRLNLDHGQEVFDREKEAVKILMDLIHDGKVPDDVKTICQNVINKLLASDKALAETALQEAVALGSTETKVLNEIKISQEELLKAANEIAKEHFDSAVDHYKHAWEHARNAIKIAM